MGLGPSGGNRETAGKAGLTGPGPAAETFMGRKGAAPAERRPAGF